MYERILIPLDGSKVGESGLRYVESLITKLSGEVKTEVTLLQVVIPFYPQVTAGYAVPYVPYPEKEMQDVKNEAASYLDAVGEHLRTKGAKVSSVVGFGNPTEEILRVAKEIRADLIAMSTHGRSGINRWVFGSVTDEVLRRGLDVPVLVVKAHEG